MVLYLSIARYTLALVLPLFLLFAGCDESGGVAVGGKSVQSSFWLSKSKGGAEAVTFDRGERIYFNHTIVNTGDVPLPWSLSDIRPTSEFRVVADGNRLRSSFDGVTFAAMPISGTLLPGDTLTENWGDLVAGDDLSSGGYEAHAIPMIAPGGVSITPGSFGFEVR